MIQHVTLEVREEDALAEAEFWGLLGFAAVPLVAGLDGRALWLERAGTQIHLGFEAQPVIPPEGHVAVVAEDYDAACRRLVQAGHEVTPRQEHWGAPRCFTRSPAGHRVEVMAAPPGG